MMMRESLELYLRKADNYLTQFAYHTPRDTHYENIITSENISQNTFISDRKL